MRGKKAPLVSRVVLTLAVAFGLAVVATRSAQAQTFTDLFNFNGRWNGRYPEEGLVRDAAGNLYGVTSGGGHNQGLVFKVSKSGKEKVLYDFCSRHGCTDGSNPYARLIRDTAGNLYGTTYYGGSSTCGGYGCGVVFKVDTNGKETVLYNFAGGSDGCYPYGGLLGDKAGNLYGTTESCGASNVGTVFKLNKNGKETVLHSFGGYPSDGAYPQFTSLLVDPAGNIYGITKAGGSSNGGVAFKLSTTGTYTVLHSFTGGTMDGCYAYGTPAMDKNGSLYGTASSCGSSDLGIVWKVTANGTETVLHNFAGGSSDGASPYGGLIMDAAGNLYGDTFAGGANGIGTVYQLNAEGMITLLGSFDGSDGSGAEGGLIFDADGNLYGITLYGGSGHGTVWKLTP